MGSTKDGTPPDNDPPHQQRDPTDSELTESGATGELVGAGAHKSELTEREAIDSDLAEAIVAAVATRLSDEQKTNLVQTLSVSRSFSGPLPPPEDFERYNQVAPDAANRILAMAEKEQQIRADGQAGAIRNDGRRINGAIAMGVALIVVAGLATWLNSPLIALPLGLVGMVTVLIRQLLEAAERHRQKGKD